MKMEISLLDLRICKAMAMYHHRTEMEVILLFSSIPYLHPMEMEVRLQCNSILGSLIRGTHPSMAEGHNNAGSFVILVLLSYIVFFGLPLTENMMEFSIYTC